MLSPKRVKHRKQHRGRKAGLSRAQTKVQFGEYGLKSLDAGWLTNRQIAEALVLSPNTVIRHVANIFAKLEVKSRAAAVAIAASASGTRIQNIVDELGGEKIDIVEWSSEVREFISNALSPAKPTDSLLIEEGDVHTAVVIVPDRQLSLAIGKEGQNARQQPS